MIRSVVLANIMKKKGKLKTIYNKIIYNMNK
jgi:hypothetical protein